VRNLPEITGMRGFAALYVLLFHIFLYSLGTAPAPASMGFLQYGWIGVDFFFVLSGFLLSLPFLSQPRSAAAPGAWRTYVLKRWWRIAPPYYVSIIVALALSNQLDYLLRNPLDIALHLSFLHSWRLESMVTIVGVYWTLASEFQFYLLLPLFVLLLRRPSWPLTLAGLGAITMVWRAATYHPTAGGSWLSFTLPAFLLHFAFGILAARAFVAGRRLPLGAGGILFAIGGLIVVPLMILGTGTAQGDGSLASNIILRPMVGLGFAALIFLTVSQPSVFQRLFASRPMHALGVRSYSLYLIHIPILDLLVRWNEVSAHGFWVLATIGVGVSLAATVVFHLFAEKPSMAFREWFIERRQRSRVPDVASASMPTAAA
jgi:peptidoglycan/LPS O-acetylase OafA/YrhL